jgi:hypothetical protein
LLECETAWALRMPLACPLRFATAFGDGKETRGRACARKSFAFAAEGGDSFAPLPKDATISYQAGQRCSQRQTVRGFEPEMSDGTNDATDKK